MAAYVSKTSSAEAVPVVPSFWRMMWAARFAIPAASTSDPPAQRLTVIALSAVSPAYRRRLMPHLERFRNESKYFNAVSATVEVRAVPAICALPFVRAVDAVAVYRRGDEPAGDARDGHPRLTRADDPLIDRYGESIHQLEQIGATGLLEMGYNGSGAEGGTAPVLVCVMDTGFNRDHEALRHIGVVAERDFVQGDSVTRNEPGDADFQDRHGTAVLGVIAGYHEGDLIGPAWGAEYLLAKTEINGTEIQVEEDNWVAGIEWADSAGADIVTSSLGYIDWYDPVDLDGDTPLCTRAADIAASRGIVVVNAAGNRGLLGLIAPADGDSVIAVGAVDRYGLIVGFSSRGPTADGRIKPDLVAMGLYTRSIRDGTTTEYGDHNGTSFAAPLVAGLCALLLEVHPEWGPMELRDRLTADASRSAAPDTVYGYGIPAGLTTAGIETPDFEPFVSRAYPNPFSRRIELRFGLPVMEPVSVKVYDVRGALVRSLVDDRNVRWSGRVVWDGTNDGGRAVAAGVYFLLFETRSVRRSIKVLRLR